MCSSHTPLSKHVIIPLQAIPLDKTTILVIKTDTLVMLALIFDIFYYCIPM